MKNILKNKKLLIGLAVAIILIIIIVVAILVINSKNENQKFEEVTNNYVTYISINPSIKLEFSQTCKDESCDEPIVTNYELINNDAKDIYKDLKIKENSSLSEVLVLICETAKNNDIVFECVEIYSDWVEVEKYIDETSTSDIWVYNINIKEKEELEDIENSLKNDKMVYIVTFDTDGGNEIVSQTIKENELVIEPSNPTKSGYTFVEWQLDGERFDFASPITNNITLVAIWEEQVSNESDSNEKPNNNPSGNDNQNNNSSNNNNDITNGNQNNNSNNNNDNNIPDKDDTTSEVDPHQGVINLNDNVLYSESEIAYSCDNCIPDSILSLLKSAKGYYDYNAGVGSDSSYVWYKRIVLSGKYNTPVYKGQNYDFESMLINAGATFAGGSYDDPYMLLTEEICDKYKLSCDRW